MNWDAIGAIAELLGAIAVVLTLLYLARETGKSASAVDATSLREVAEPLATRLHTRRMVRVSRHCAFRVLDLSNTIYARYAQCWEQRRERASAEYCTRPA